MTSLSDTIRSNSARPAVAAAITEQAFARHCRLLQLERQGKTQKEIADILGIDKTSVSRLRARFPAPPKPRHPRQNLGRPKTPKIAAPEPKVKKSELRELQLQIRGSRFSAAHLYGDSLLQIALEHRTKPERVRFLIRQAGGETFSNERRAQQRWELFAKDVAGETQLPARRRNGAALPRYQIDAHIRYLLIVEALRKGQDLHEIATGLDITPRSVKRILRRYGAQSLAESA